MWYLGLDQGYPENSLHFTNTLSHLSVMPLQTKCPCPSIHLFSSSPAIQYRPRQQNRNILSTILFWNIKTVRAWRGNLPKLGQQAHRTLPSLPLISASKYPNGEFQLFQDLMWLLLFHIQAGGFCRSMACCTWPWLRAIKEAACTN